MNDIIHKIGPPPSMHTRSGFRVFLAATLLLCAASGNAFSQGQKITPDTRPATSDERDNPQERARWFMRGRTVNGKPAPELLHKAYQQKMSRRPAVKSRATSANITTAATSSGSTLAVNPSVILTTNGPAWTPLGPAPSGTASPGDPSQDYGPVVGRTTVVVVDQSDPTGNTVYVGGASGGLWKSTNAADSNIQNCGTVTAPTPPTCAPNVTWTPLTDQQATLTVGAMAIKPGDPNWLLVGTGEANNSADSYYGLGFLLSKDGGSTWTLISSATGAGGSGSIDLHGLGTTAIAFSSDNPLHVVATMAGASEGIALGAEFATSGTNTPRGIYFSADGGATWQRSTINDPRGTIQPGSANTVVYNPVNKTFYADIRWHGVYYSTDDGQTFNLLSAQPGGATLNISGNCPVAPLTNGGSCPIYRSVLSIVPGRNEMYIWIVDVSDGDKGLYQTLDGGATWTALSTSGIDNCGDGTNGSCGTTQGSYNLSLLAVPNGAGTDLWAGAVNEYHCTMGSPSNPAGCSFSNMTHTYGKCNNGDTGAFSHVHPDEHGVDFVHAKPALVYFGNDGGVYRTLNGFNTTTKLCNNTSQPSVQFDNLNGNMGSMLQFVWFSQSPADSASLIGGTQDNGSMAKGSASPVSPYGFGYSWQTINNGDGGFNDINPTNPKEWFTSTPQSGGHVDIEQCINSSGISCVTGSFTQIVTQSALGGDAAPFYIPFMLDPQAANHILAGTCRLWRVDRGTISTSWPNTSALTYNLDAFSTAGTFACSSTSANQVSAIAAGGPCTGVCNSGTNGTGNGSQVIYVGTNAGKLFVTTSADGGAATWNDRSAGLNNTTGCSGTGCPISGIAVDPTDATGQTAYVTVMGFKTGHVFMTTNAGRSWTNLDGDPASTGLPDNPADAAAVDSNTPGLVYVATDVGVFQSSGDGVWTEVGLSNGVGALPNVATTALHTFGTGASTRLRVSTYGRGIWEISTPSSPAPTVSISRSPSALLGQSATVTGTITPPSGFSGQFSLTCVAGKGRVPAICSVSPSVVSNGQFTLNLSDPTAGYATFALKVTDLTNTLVPALIPVTFSEADFTLPSTQSATVNAGVTAQFALPVTAVGQFPAASPVSFDPQNGGGCLVANASALVTCTLSSTSVDLSSGSATLTVSLKTTGTATASISHPTAPTNLPFEGALLAICAITGIAFLPDRRSKALSLLVTCVIGGLIGCGGGGNNTVTQPASSSRTPAGTYQVTVTGVAGTGSGALKHSTTISLTVN